MKLKTYYRALSVIGLGVALNVSGTSFAQEQNEGAAEEVVVTGSFIRGTPENAALPVDVIGLEDLRNQGAPSTLDLIKSLPVSNGVIGDSNQFDARSQGLEGVGSINLRGLGPERTLVLMNGKRFAGVPFGVGNVDTNSIPSAAIGRVEILKDGAAATYGSDAVSGVVNFITNDRLDGLQVAADYRYISDSDGDWTASVAHGFQGDRVRLLHSFGYQHRSPLEARDRDFAVRPFSENPNFGWSQGGNPSVFIPITGSFTPTGNLTLDPGCASLGGAVTVDDVNRTRCATNFSGYSLLVDKEDRFQAYGEAEITLSDTHTLELSALWAHTEVDANTSSSYNILNAPSATAGGVAGRFYVPSTNPGLVAFRAANPSAFPFGATQALIAPGTFRVALAGGTPGFNANDVPGASPVSREGDSFRFTAELNGDLSPYFNYSLSTLYHNYERQSVQYDVLTDRVQLALRGLGGPNCNVAANTPGQNGCQWFNPFSNAVQSNSLTGAVNPNFNPAVANSAELYEWMNGEYGSRLNSELYVTDLVFSGTTGVSLLGGEEIGYAFGGQYRKNTLDRKYSAFQDLTDSPCSTSVDFGLDNCAPASQVGPFGFLFGNTPGRSSQDVYAVFGELQVPVGDSINVQLAARYEDYGGAIGSTFDPKLTARWQALDWLAFRGSASTTFRGPPVSVTEEGDRVVSLQALGGSFRGVSVIDSPTLEPETATNYSAGIVVEKGGFDLTVDYWRIEMEDRLTTEPVGGLFATYFAGATQAARCASPLASRFFFSDGAAGGGCAFDSSGAVVGGGNASSLTRIDTFVVNGPSLLTDGVDLLASYEFDLGQATIDLGSSITVVTNYESGGFSVNGVEIEKGFNAVGKLNYQTSAYPIPRYRGNAFVNFGQGAHNARLTVNYVHSYRDQRSLAFNETAIAGDLEIDKFVTTDFTYRVKLPAMTDINFTVGNITDEYPDFARLDFGYDPFTGNPLGRTFKAGVVKRF